MSDKRKRVTLLIQIICALLILAGIILTTVMLWLDRVHIKPISKVPEVRLEFREKALVIQQNC